MATKPIFRRFPREDVDPDLYRRHFFYDRKDDSARTSAERIKPRLSTFKLNNDDIEDIGTLSILDDLNKSYREHRRRIFRHKLMTNKKAKIIVSEGDSWHLYPIFIDEIVDQLNKDKNLAIYSVDGAGDTARDMFSQFRDDLEGLGGATALVHPVTVLLDGGGNDLLEQRRTSTGALMGNLFFHLNDYRPGMSPQQLLKPSIGGEMDRVIALLTYMVDRVITNKSVGRVVIHGYDYAFPDNDVWLGKPMKARRIPAGMQRGVVIELMDRFHAKLESAFSPAHYPLVRYVDLRGTVTSKTQWFDELHPNSTGFKKITAKIKPHI